MAQLISGRYSGALFELALEKNTLDEYLEQVKLVKEVFSDGEFKKFINHPQVDAESKLKFIESALKGKVSDDILGLFNVMLHKNREPEIIDVLDSFIERADKYARRTVAHVTSAVPLSDAQLNGISENISKKLNKQVEVKTYVNPELMGGISVKVDGMVIDGTIKKRMDDLTKQLIGLQLA